MQFNSNSDFPASHLPKEQWGIVAQPPIPFGEAKFVPCACITTRILISVDNVLAGVGLDDDVLTDAGSKHIVAVGGVNYLVQTAKGVLVRTPTPTLTQYGQNGAAWSDSSDSSVDGDEQGDGAMPQSHGADEGPQLGERAYWLRRTLRAAIYGQVRYGVTLRKLCPPVQLLLPGISSPAELATVEWEATPEGVAVKEMSWDHIHSQRHRLAEDPIKEIAAMQHLENWFRTEYIHQQQQEEEEEQLRQQQQHQILQQHNFMNINAQLSGMNLAHQSAAPNISQFTSGGFSGIGNSMNQYRDFSNAALSQSSQGRRPCTMLEAHVMVALDSLTDGRNLYCVMPYCSGGELFDVLEKKTRFSEPEARYWMRQLLQGLMTLKEAGICHRDLSLENLLVHGNNALIIDMGMCLRVPVMDTSTKRRFLITPQGTCGKWHYMSPEICSNSGPFDGHAVDLWAAGVILFLMLTGYPPWEKPVLSDERFRYMTNGYLVHMLTEWKTGLTADAMDLLQRMFCQSFAPPATHISSVSVRRWSQALSSASSSDLSGLLNEYKSAASPVSTSASSVPSPPVTAVVTPQVDDFAESSMRSLTDAVTAATDAADAAAQAAASAMAAASQTAATTKAAVATAATSNIQTIPGGVKILPGGFQFKPPQQAVDATDRIGESFATLKANFISGVGSMKVDSADTSRSFDFDLNSLSASPIVPAIVDSLHLKEYGGWYVAAAMAITASQQRAAGREEASLQFETELELARQKANEAASAAGLAAEGARMAKSLAMKMEKSSGQDAGKSILESSRMKQIQMEKELMEKELGSLKSQVTSLQMQLKKIESSTKTMPKNDTYKSEIEEEYPTKVTMERDPEEDSRIVELLKEMDEENKQKKLMIREQLETKREEEAKYVAEQKAKAEAEQLAKEEAARLEAEAAKVEAEKMAKEVEDAQSKAEEAKIKSVEKGASAKKVGPTPKKAVKKAAKSKGKSVTKKISKSPDSPSPAASNEWHSLSDATLNRKTVAEITAYLTERGVSVTDESGKVYKKAELVAAVKSLV
eukprot:CCRYP_006503-RA/>CCRYP_006503-RA protein AED:0.11 eAED:0.11 QI:231/0.83/0.71/1/0.83/0.71/7/34/1041